MPSEASGSGKERWDLEAFGREWSRMEHIFGLDWNRIFPHGKREMSPNGYMIRMVLDDQIPYGSSVWAEENLYWPAIDHAVAVGLVEMAEDEDGNPVVRLPEGEEPYGIKGPSGGGAHA